MCVGLCLCAMMMRTLPEFVDVKMWPPALDSCTVFVCVCVWRRWRRDADANLILVMGAVAAAAAAAAVGRLLEKQSDCELCVNDDD